MKKKVKLKAYAAANLGDDLFIELICNRYPNVQFYLCGSKKFYNIYGKIPNLKYRCWDTFRIRIWGVIYRLLRIVFNILFKNNPKVQISTDELLNNKYALYSDYNVYITGSGFMNSSDEFETLPEKYERELIYYKRHPFVIGCNFGPFAHKEYLEMYRQLFSYASDVCFRDKYSLQYFDNLKVVRTAADIVFSYPIESLKNINRLIDKEYMLISVANLKKDNDMASDFYEEYLKFVRNIIIIRSEQKKYTVLLGFSKEQNDDIAILSILKEVTNNKYLYNFCYPDISSSTVISLFRDAQNIIATRYHAMILALMFEKPVCTICYNEKINHVLEEVNMQDSIICLEDMGKLDYSKLIREKMCQIDQGLLKKLVKSSNEQFRELDKVLF